MECNWAYCTGWRKINYWRKKLKAKMLLLSRATVDKSKNRSKRIREAACNYLHTARLLYDKALNSKLLNPCDIVEAVMHKHLKYFSDMLLKHIDLVDRRLLKEEKIPHEEKIFSVFEPWVEWICKGKAHKPVELGKRTCIASDQWHFIIDWCVANHQQDNQLLLPLIDRIRNIFGAISPCSCDKAFFSKIDVDVMELFAIKAVIPKKGKRSIADIQRESAGEFIKAKRAHSAVESNINELEHRGLDRCPDKGLKGMLRYVGLAVIAYNLRRIGQILLERDRNNAEEKKKQVRPAARNTAVVAYLTRYARDYCALFAIKTPDFNIY
jgi:hypothetical protein